MGCFHGIHQSVSTYCRALWRYGSSGSILWSFGDGDDCCPCFFATIDADANFEQVCADLIQASEEPIRSLGPSVLLRIELLLFRNSLEHCEEVTRSLLQW